MQIIKTGRRRGREREQERDSKGGEGGVGRGRKRDEELKLEGSWRELEKAADAETDGALLFHRLELAVVMTTPALRHVNE
jgi:hypothetical protein